MFTADTMTIMQVGDEEESAQKVEEIEDHVTTLSTEIGAAMEAKLEQNDELASSAPPPQLTACRAAEPELEALTQQQGATTAVNAAAAVNAATAVNAANAVT
ncbi:hypothetical protein JCM1840_001457 [Sporobolomyces johnsonii]